MRWWLGLAVLCVGCQQGPAPLPIDEGTCAPTARSALFGCWRVETSISSLGIKTNDVLAFTENDVVLRRNEFEWMRMPVSWDSPTVATRLSGTTMGTEHLTLQLVGDRVILEEDDKTLGAAQRFAADEATALGYRLDALPSLNAMRERAQVCFAAYKAVRPNDTAFQNVQPERWVTTASVHALLQMAQENLLAKCLPVPPECALPPMKAEVRARLAEARAVCAREVVGVRPSATPQVRWSTW
jgi:hypothetical protein